MNNKADGNEMTDAQKATWAAIWAVRDLRRTFETAKVRQAHRDARRRAEEDFAGWEVWVTTWVA